MDSLNQLVDVQNQAWSIYHDSYFVIPGAPPEFRELIEATTTVQDAIRWVDAAVLDSSHPLSTGGPDVIHNVVVMCNAIRRTLNGVEKLVARYRRVAGPATDLASLSVKLWGKLKWQVEKKTVVELTSRLRTHTYAVNLYMSTVGGAAPDHIECILEDLFDEVYEHRQRRVYGDIKVRMPSVSESVRRKPVELPASVPATTFAVELDSVEIPRPPQLQGSPQYHEASESSQSPGSPPIPPKTPISTHSHSTLPEVDVVKMQMAEMDPVIWEEKMIVDEVGLDDILRHESEEKIVVDEIMLEAERFLVQRGFPRAERRMSMRRKGSRRSVAVPEFNRTMVVADQMPVIEEPIAVTYSDLPPAYNVYSKSDIIGLQFSPGEKISETFRLASAHNFDVPDWPKTTADWLRMAAWWLLKSKLSVEANGTSPQTFIDWAKASWILTEVIPPTVEQQAVMEKDLQIVYTDLWQQLKGVFFKHQSAPLEHFTPTTEALQFLESMQPEERSRGSDPVLVMDLFEVLTQPDPHVRLRSFVALEFGIIKPSTYPQIAEVNYLFVLFMDPRTRETRITVYNQNGSIQVHRLLTEENIGPALHEGDLNSWCEMDWNRRTIFAGFASLEAAIPYVAERNSIRKELLERPVAIYAAEVEKARFVPQNTAPSSRSIAAGWVGPAKLKLMEMRRAGDENQRYREIIIENQFTTTNIPLHSIKIVPSDSNRLTLFWPTFEVPREDLRSYLHSSINPNMHIKYGYFAGSQKGGKLPDEDWFWHPYVRLHTGHVTITSNDRVLHVVTKFRKMSERTCDIETTRQSDRMLDIIFRNSTDLRNFIRDAGGTGQWSSTEIPVFHRTSATFQIHLFRELDGTMRLCMVESGLYCNFFLDAQSTYLVDPNGDLSLWDVIWSPSGNISRQFSTYLPDSLDLSILDRAAVHDFFAAMFPTQSVAIFPASSVVGRKASLTKYMSTKTMSCPNVTMLVVRSYSSETNACSLRLVLCGYINSTTLAQPPVREMRKVVAKVPLEYHWESTGKPMGETLRITFKGTEELQVRSYNRERSKEKPIFLGDPEGSKKRLAEVCTDIEFCVKETEWAYAMTVLGVKKPWVRKKRGTGYCV